MSQPTALWLQTVISVIAGVLVGVIIGQFVPFAMRRLTSPRLRVCLSTRDRTHYIRHIPGAISVDGHWLGVWVENRRPLLGKPAAVECSADLVSVEHIGDDGHAEEIPSFVPDRIAWASMGEREFKEKDIYPGQPARISVCCKRSDNPSTLFWQIQPTAMASGRLTAVQPGKYRIRIRVHAANAVWTETTLNIKHGCGMDDLEVEQIR
jgi:hypothetical protein